jgi:hypothetical protein
MRSLALALLLTAILGAIFNRLRGSGIRGGRWINVIAFGFLCGWLYTPIIGVFAALGMAIGQSLGWGRYIGALGGWEQQELKEVWFIDAVISPLKHNMRLWGFVGLMLRGMFWGACIGISIGSVWPMLAGATMPLCYLLALHLTRWTDNPQGRGWEVGEVLFGAVLWASVALILT